MPRSLLLASCQARRPWFHPIRAVTQPHGSYKLRGINRQLESAAAKAQAKPDLHCSDRPNFPTSTARNPKPLQVVPASSVAPPDLSSRRVRLLGPPVAQHQHKPSLLARLRIVAGTRLVKAAGVGLRPDLPPPVQQSDPCTPRLGVQAFRRRCFDKPAPAR